MRVLKQLTIIAFAAVLVSCLQAFSEGSLPDYIPRAQPVRSGPFAVNGDDMLIVSVTGAVLQSGIGPEHFSLTVDNRSVPLPAPVRAGDSHVLFGFDLPLENHYNFRLTVNPGAVQGGTAGMRVTARAVSSGARIILEDTVFGNYAIRTISYGNGFFIAAGEAGVMAHSSDGGRNWIPVPPGPGGSRFDDAIYALAFGVAGGPRFYAVGGEARVSWSSGGRDWNAYRLPPPPQVPGLPPPPPVYGHSLFDGGDIHAVAFGRRTTSADARFVMAGGGGRTAFRWFDPGMHSWTWVSGTGLDPDGVVYALVWGDTGGNGRFVAGGCGGSVYWAADGVESQHWTLAGGAAELFEGHAVRAAAFGNGVFVVGGDGGRIAWSADGMYWNPAGVCAGEAGTGTETGNSAFGTSGVLDIAFASGVFVAVGRDGKMALSTDGANWELVPNGGFAADERINGIATDGRGRFVAVGNNGNGLGRIVSWYQKPVGKGE